MKPSVTETSLWVTLNRAHRRFHRSIESELRTHGFPSLRWYDVLWGVEQAGEQGVRARELGHSLIFEQSNLSRILQQMVQRGLILETVSETDRRSKKLHITPAGRDLRQKMWAIYGDQIHVHMKDLARAETKDALLFLLGEGDREEAERYPRA